MRNTQQLLTYIFILAILGSVLGDNCNPRMIKLQIGDYYSDPSNPNTARISFQTFGECLLSEVRVIYENQTDQYFNKSQTIHSYWDGQVFCMGDCQPVYYDQYIHTLDLQIPTGVNFQYEVLIQSRPGEIYISKFYNARLPNLKQKENEPVHHLFFGDFDQSAIGNYTWDMLDTIYSQKDPAWNISHFVFLGDYAYEFWQENGTKGDQVLQRFQKYLTKWPYTITAGNHEEQYNFTFFNQKFQMLNYAKTQNFYYSYNIGLVHFISFNIQYYTENQGEVSQQMLKWLKEDLIEANRNRKDTPWIVAFSHYPIYTNDSDSNEYYNEAKEIDSLFYQFNVDLLLSGHKHSYNLILPIYQNNIVGYSEQVNQTLINPRSYIQLIQGNGGNEEMEIEDNHNFKLPTTVNSVNPGLGKLTVINSTAILLQAYDSVHQVIISNYTIISNHQYNTQSQTILDI